MLLIQGTLVGCGPSAKDFESIDYTPIPSDDWPVSTPAEQGLDPILVAELYYHAAELETIYGLLVIKNGFLIAEDYFHEGSLDQQPNLQSTTKSYFSALTGIALDQGCLSGVDQKLLTFFPEIAGKIKDQRKAEITIQDLLQMRSGYPWEESDPALFEALLAGKYMTREIMLHFPLVSNPGEEFNYSTLSTYWLGVIVARACDTDLKSFAQQYLFSPMGAELGDIWQDDTGYYYPNMFVSARDQARFGQLYLDGGQYQGKQIIPAEWITDSLQTYSVDAWTTRVGRNFNDVGYGYQWWSVRAGEHNYNLAWGHGGQQIVLLKELEIVIVVTADPFWGQHNDQAWKHEKANLNLVANFIASLPDELETDG